MEMKKVAISAMGWAICTAKTLEKTEVIKRIGINKVPCLNEASIVAQKLNPKH